MKKIFVIIALASSLSIQAQKIDRIFGPAFATDKNGFFTYGIHNYGKYFVEPKTFSGTIEYKSGFQYLRTDKGDLYLLNFPKFGGLTLDTNPYSGTSKVKITGFVDRSSSMIIVLKFEE